MTTKERMLVDELEERVVRVESTLKKLINLLKEKGIIQEEI